MQDRAGQERGPNGADSHTGPRSWADPRRWQSGHERSRAFETQPRSRCQGHSQEEAHRRRPSPTCRAGGRAAPAPAPPWWESSALQMRQGRF